MQSGYSASAARAAACTLSRHTKEAAMKKLHVAGFVLASIALVDAAPDRQRYLFNDSHVHLTNYVQVGPDVHDFLKVMGDKVGRATLFGIPLQQTWSYRLSQNDAPTYYLDTDADLYYYSFTDAVIAMEYRSLTSAEQQRFDPMITGFNPADMYAADHVRRVLQTFPGVFEGIGEFSIHKEFVTSKVAGEPPSIEDPALDRLLSFAEEVGLVVLVHCDADVPFPKPGAEPAYLHGIHDLLRRHPGTTFIWAHAGVGRVVRPVNDHLKYLETLLDDPKLSHVYIDISWSETAKYVDATPDTVRRTAAVIAKHPDRFLFGTDEVGPKTQADELRVYEMYKPLWKALKPADRELVLKGNYERLFDEARRRVRAWEMDQRTKPQSARR
jgi:hypothetical protein